MKISFYKKGGGRAFAALSRQAQKVKKSVENAASKVAEKADKALSGRYTQERVNQNAMLNPNEVKRGLRPSTWSKSRQKKRIIEARQIRHAQAKAYADRKPWDTRTRDEIYESVLSPYKDRHIKNIEKGILLSTLPLAGYAALGIIDAESGHNNDETMPQEFNFQSPYRYAGGKWQRLGNDSYQNQTAEYGKDRNGDINYYSEGEGQWIPEGNYGLRGDGSVVDTQGNVIGYDPTYQNYVNSVGKNEKPLNAIDYYQALAEELNFDSPEKIKKFQQKMDIPDDGIFGPQTLAAYRKLNFGARQQLLGQSYRNGGKLGMLRDSIERAGSKLFS